MEVNLSAEPPEATYGNGEVRSTLRAEGEEIAMGWIVLGAILAILLGVALVVDLRDRKRGGTKLARGNGLRDAREDDAAMHPTAGEQQRGSQGFLPF